MKKSDSEIISAFLDNELSESEVAMFKKRLQEDALFANEFTKYSENDLALKQHVSLMDNVPVPESIMNLLKETEDRKSFSEKLNSNKSLNVLNLQRS